MARQDSNNVFALTSFLYGANAAYIEELYAQYQENPASVDAEWQDFFVEYGFEIINIYRDDWQIKKFFILLGLGSFKKLIGTVKNLVWKLITLKFAHQFIFILEKSKHDRE